MTPMLNAPLGSPASAAALFLQPCHPASAAALFSMTLSSQSSSTPCAL
eukprot:CAMPEP_0175925162 /NCGR_PEP_ID=MMETSP0108-20121206/15500_1 /TAXON_ID=195067 ORGANISM="Goniomonas pacifica, Strain CCMP1869" /NCGR_SAMPLE_ID=MMETSP0108 /ASSEMBLY_ACC=CAM_ASM_000204 /LENGTH=47 /DNA_ID= /DNA_START= /DNA_END= /DNA_ORIENTATION=